MFRPLRRAQKEIEDEKVLNLLKMERRGVFAVNGDDGYPFAIPVNFLFDEEANKIYFHGAKEGHKVDSLKKDDKICFTVYGNEFYKEGEWAPYMQSVVIFGRCKLVSDPELTAIKVRELAIKYYPNSDEIDNEMKIIGRTQLYEISIEHMTGKQIQER